MGEFVGLDSQVRIQKRMRQRQAWIAHTPGAINAGRAMAFDDPGRVGWDRVTALANEDDLAVFCAFPEAKIKADIGRHLGPGWKTSSWGVYFGTAAAVMAASQSLLDAHELPADWRMIAPERPDDRQIDAVQLLNQSTGVLPYPAFFSRGEASPIVTVCLTDETGALAATASAVMRHHADSRLGGHLFTGMVSVLPVYRGRGLGKLVNAAVLVESHARFGWSVATEQAAAHNHASRAMIEACGLRRDEGVVSVAAINSDEAFTR